MHSLRSTLAIPATLADRVWVLLLLPASAFLVVGTVHLLADEPVAAGLAFVQGNIGMTWDEFTAQSPTVATAILGFQRMMAMFAMAFALLDLGMILTAYRTRERWAWFAAWLNLVVIVGFGAVASAYDGWGTGPWSAAAVPAGAILIAMVLLGLLVPFRTSFPDGDAGVAKPQQRTG